MISSTPGWEALDDTHGWGDIRGSRDRIVPLGNNGFVTLALIEIPVTDRYPAFTERKKLYLRCSNCFGDMIAIVVDAAETRRTWCWQRKRPGLPDMYRERAQRAEREHISDLLSTAMADLTPMVTRRTELSACIGSALRWAMTKQVGTATRAVHRALPVPEQVRVEIESSDDVGLARLCWRELLRLALLDLRCGDGGWLLEAMDVLEPLYDTCLQRMAGQLADEDQSAGRGTRRNRDLRKLLARAGYDQRRHDRVFIRRTILLHNLHGVAQNPMQAQISRERLAMALAAGGPERRRAELQAPELPHRVIMLRDPPAPDEVKGSARAPRSSRLEEALTYESVYTIIRDLQLGGRIDPEELRAAYGALERRRLQLSHERALDCQLKGTGRNSLAELLVHFPWLSRTDRNLIVRPS